MIYQKRVTQLIATFALFFGNCAVGICCSIPNFSEGFYYIFTDAKLPETNGGLVNGLASAIVAEYSVGMKHGFCVTNMIKTRIQLVDNENNLVNLAGPGCQAGQFIGEAAAGQICIIRDDLENKLQSMNATYSSNVKAISGALDALTQRIDNIEKQRQ